MSSDTEKALNTRSSWLKTQATGVKTARLCSHSNYSSETRSNKISLGPQVPRWAKASSLSQFLTAQPHLTWASRRCYSTVSVSSSIMPQSFGSLIHTRLAHLSECLAHTTMARPWIHVNFHEWASAKIDGSPRLSTGRPKNLTRTS